MFKGHKDSTADYKVFYKAVWSLTPKGILLIEYPINICGNGIYFAYLYDRIPLPYFFIVKTYVD